MPFRNRPFALAALLANLILLPLPSHAAEAPAAAGHWEGEIQLPNNVGQLQVMVDLSQDAGAWKGEIDIPAQGAKDLPLEGIAVEGSKVKFTIAGVPGAPTFDGALENGEIRGAFRQGGGAMTFRLGRQAVELPRRPQEPKPPFPYAAEEVTYDNGGIKLAGTLTIPPGPGPFPAVLLITGSGTQDRDESLLGHKPFLVIADHLSRHGIAVLRVDDRGAGGSTGKVKDSTTADFAQDALAGVRFLKGHPKIAAGRIGLLGHSEGGVIGPLAASQSPDVAFVVMLAGTGVPGPEILYRQSELISRADGSSEESIQRDREAMRKAFDVLRAEKDPATREARLKAVTREAVATMNEEDLKAAGGVDAAAEAQVRQMDTNWFRYFIDYDPRPALRKVKVPVLALNGGLDLQVPPSQNLPAIEKALKEGGNKDFTVKELPGLNHLFQPAKTGSPNEYSGIEVTMDPAVLDLITGWIQARFGGTKP
ncbi:MAG: alpha/beta hydrolase family protein [Thermoanaerobaculia bacterium]